MKSETEEKKVQTKSAEKGAVIPTQKGISIRCDEVFNIHDAIGEACKLAAKVKR